MSRPRESRWVRAAVTEGRLSRITPSPGRTAELLRQAERHLTSAQTIGDTDPTLALAACHDAVRKAIDGYAGACGLRIENVRGHHKLVLELAAEELTEIDPDLIREADRLRDRRHQFEYGETSVRFLTVEELAEHVSTATSIVQTVKAAFAERLRTTD